MNFFTWTPKLELYCRISEWSCVKAIKLQVYKWPRLLPDQWGHCINVALKIMSAVLRPGQLGPVLHRLVFSISDEVSEDIKILKIFKLHFPALKQFCKCVYVLAQKIVWSLHNKRKDNTACYENWHKDANSKHVEKEIKGKEPTFPCNFQ